MTERLGISEAGRLAELIREQAGVEVAQVVADARARAAQLVAAAEAEAATIRAAAQREGEARGRRRAAQLLALADAASRMEWLQAREALLTTAIERAGAELAALAKRPEAAAVLTMLVQEAVRTLPDGPLHLRVAAPQQAPWQEALRQLHEVAARMQVEEAPIAGGGVLIETADGRLRLDNSFAARLQRQHDELRRLVAGVLFSKEDAVPMPEA